MCGWKVKNSKFDTSPLAIHLTRNHYQQIQTNFNESGDGDGNYMTILNDKKNKIKPKRNQKIGNF